MGKLRGIVDSKRRYQRYLRNQGLTAPPAPRGAPDPAWHIPSASLDGTLVCSCGGARYSPAAFAEHIAGKAMIDGRGGVYVLGPLDPWVIERERRQVATIEQAADVQVDDAGNSWQPFENQYRQGMLRCVAGARKGDVIHAPAMVLPPSPTEPRRTQIADGVSNPYDF